MSYFVKAAAGLAVFAAGLVVFNMKLQELLDMGTCASGNVPFQITQECPKGTGAAVLLVMGSVVLCVIGWAVFALRGDPPGRRRRRGFSGPFGSGMLVWGVFFAATGVALLVGAPYGEVTDPVTGEIVGRPDSQLGANITGITFLVMGVPAPLLGLYMLWRARARDGRSAPYVPRSAPRLVATGAVETPAATHTVDRIGELERLQRLRDSGVLSPAEFENEKARVLGAE